MNNPLPNRHIQSGLLIISGIAVICISLIRHPEDWRNWLIRAGIGLIVMAVALSVLSVIHFFKNQNLNK